MAHPAPPSLYGARPPRVRPLLPLAVLAAPLLALLLLAACADPAAPEDAAAAPWTADEVASVLDLSQLGELRFAEDGSGTILLGDRVLDPALAGDMPYGRSANVLGLDDATMNALSPEARLFFLTASPERIQAELARHGVHPADVEAARAASPGSGIAYEDLVRAVRTAAERSGGTIDPFSALGLEEER